MRPGHDSVRYVFDGSSFDNEIQNGFEFVASLVSLFYALKNAASEAWVGEDSIPVAEFTLTGRFVHHTSFTRSG